MSDSRDKNTGDEKPDQESTGVEQTLIRGQNSSASEPNDDATVLRSKDSQSQVPNDDATLVRSPEQQANDDATIVRDEKAAPETINDESSLNDNKQADGEAGEADETIVRPKDKSVPAKAPTTTPKSIADKPASGATDNGEAATILKSPGSDADSATILRSPDSNDGATILREPGEDGATILRGRDDDSSDSATILRAGDEQDDDDDRTIINDNYDDDATVIGAGGGEQDTTYIASVGKQIKPQGNSEAGRLLKNRFVLEEKIGSGGMGDVYKALDLRQQEAQERDPYIAIKLLNENFARHKDAFLSLQRETSRTRGIPHPNIMGVYDFDREGDTVFMSMELLDGKPLDDFLKEHPEGVSEEDAWNIIDGISKGLMRAHDAGIVHSDFKPGNIFYTKDKTAKVFDFGIARAVSNPNELEADGEKTVFDAGSLGALTPTYASYEMLKGLEPSKSDDVYAVALVAYELFMGKHPYDRVPADKALERGLKPKPVPFLKRRHWKALRKALELKGENRTQSMDEFYETMFSVDPPYFRYAAVAAMLMVSIGFGAYQTLNVKEKPLEMVEFEDAIAGSLATLRTVERNPQWESNVWHDQVSTALARWIVADQNILENEEWVDDWEYVHDPEIEVWRGKVLDAYLKEIERLRGDAQGYADERLEQYGIVQALEMLNKANDHMQRVLTNYKSADSARAEQERSRLEIALKLRNDRMIALEAEEAAEEQRIAEAKAAAEAAEKQRVFEENRLATYNIYLEELREILKCKGEVPLEEQDRLGVLLVNMKNEWAEAYEYHYPTFVNYLSTCIEQRIGLVDPDDARELQAKVMTFLPGETQIASLVIEDKDPCDDRKLIGRGNRNRSWCSDNLRGGGVGPELVVIPPMTVKSQKYAISRGPMRIG
jgi:serine/threonine protein kinase